MILRDLGMGGAERVTVRLANYAARNGIETHVITLTGAGPLQAELDNRVCLHSLGAERIRRALIPLYRKLSALSPDAVMATLPQVNALTVAVSRFLAKKPKVVLREANDPRFEAPYKSGAKKWVGALIGAAYRRADKIIAVSSGVRDGLIQKYALSPGKVVALPNASLDDRIFVKAQRTLDDPWYSALERRVVCVARFAPQKDHFTLLEAFARLNRRKSIGLVLIGGGPLERKIREQISVLGLEQRVKVVTGEGNPYRWLRDANLLVLSSKWEGSPNVLVEALALGVPVVSTDCPSGPRELLVGGRYGELVPVGDVAALAQALTIGIDMGGNTASLKERGMEFHVDRVGPAWLAELEPA